MFHAIEKYRTTAQVILGLIGLSFIGFGAATLSPRGHDFIGEVGDFKVSSADVDNAVRRLQSAGQTQVDRNTVYQSLLQEAYLQQAAADLGVHASLEQIKKVIVNDPSFQAGGKFSEQLYRSFLQNNGLTEEALVENMRKQFAMQTVVALGQAGNIVSDAQAAQLLQLLQAPREMRSAVFKAADFAAKVPVDDAKLQAFYQANKKRYTIEQAVKFQYVVLSAKDLAAKQSVSSEELKTAYEQMPSSASAPKPSFAEAKAQLTEQIKNKKAQAALQTAKEKLSDLAFNNPKDLKKVAAQMGLTLQTHDTWLTRKEAAAANMPEALQNALFSNDVLVKQYNSEPVAVQNDYWVVRAEAVRQAHQAAFAEAAAQVRSDYVAQESRKLALAAAQNALKTAQQGGKGIAWSDVSAVTAQQASSVLAGKDLQQWVQARPAQGKPVYLLTQNTAEPMLLEIQSIKPLDNLAQMLPQTKQGLAQSNGNTMLVSLLEWMKQKYPVVQGAQKLQQDDS